MGSRFDGRKVYVGNLVAETTNEQLESLFSKFGPIINIWVARKPPGFAFITFQDPRDATDAIDELDGTEFQGSTIKVEASKPPRSRDRRGRDPYSKKSPSYGGRSRSHSSGRRIRSRSPSYGRSSRDR